MMMRFLDSITALAGDIHEALATRLELVSAEFELEKIRSARVAALSVLGGGALFAFLLCLFGLALHLTSERYEHLVYLAGIFAFGLLTLICGRLVRKLVVGEPRPFAGTMEELRKDRECLSSISKN